METVDREQLLAKAMALEEKLHHAHRVAGYQLGASDLIELDNMIQRAIAEGSPDGLRQFMAIRTAHEVHGKISYDQLKLLKEVAHVLANEDAFKSHRL